MYKINYKPLIRGKLTEDVKSIEVHYESLPSVIEIMINVGYLLISVKQVNPT